MATAVVTPPALKPLIPSELVPALNFTVVKDGASLEKLRQFLSRVSVVGIDYETNITPTFFRRRARTLQIGDKNEQFIIDWMEWTGGRDNLIASQGHFGSKSPWGEIASPFHRKLIQPVLEVVRPVFDSRQYLKLGINLEFEYIVSKWCFGLRLWNLYDAQMVEKCIHLGTVSLFASGFWAMDDMVARRLGVEVDKTYQKIDWMEERALREEELTYCALDCRIPFVLKNLQHKDLTKGNLFRVAQIENDAIPAFGDIKIHGKKQHAAAWRELREDNKRELIDAIKELDGHFLPVAGHRDENPPDPLIVASLEAAWRDLDAKSPEELELSAQIKTLRKDPAGRAALMQQRDALEVARKAKKAENRKLYQAAKSLLTQYQNDAETWEGEARLNYNSPAALKVALLKGDFGFYEKFDKDGKRKTNLYGTDDKQLEKHAEKPVVKAIRKYRKFKKLESTYGEKWLRLTTDPEGGFTDPDTGRLHSDLVQLGADTGRTSSREPNFQNLPKEDKYRACFVARPGYKILTIDYNGCELRILAELSGEKAWIDAFNKGWDVHSVCAQFLYGERWDNETVHEEYYEEKVDKKTGEVKKKLIPKCAYAYATTELKKGSGVFEDHQKCECPKHKEFRNELKAVNFGIAYGKTAYGLAADLEISTDAAEKLLHKFAATFPTLWAYLENSGKRGLKALEARTMSQRRRLFTKVDWEQAKAKATERVLEQMKKNGIKEGDPRYRSAPYHNDIVRAYKGIEAGIERQAKNTPIQGTNADMIKLAVGCGFDSNGQPFQWHRLEPEFGGWLENIVHDEQVVEAPDETAQPAFDWCTDCMTRAGAEFVKSVPMISEGKILNRWAK